MVAKSSDYIDSSAVYPPSSCLRVFVCSTSAPPLLAIGCVLAEVCAEMASIREADTPRFPGFKQTINGSAHIIAV